MSKSKYAHTWVVEGDFWGFRVKVKAHSESEAKAKVRKMVREGKLKPKIQSNIFYASRDNWED
jgi:uncharacterized protein YajQ (UPF0234 family)